MNVHATYRRDTPSRTRLDNPRWGHTGRQHKEMVPRGLEPRTLRLLAVRSNQLSYETLDSTGWYSFFIRMHMSAVGFEPTRSCLQWILSPPP